MCYVDSSSTYLDRIWHILDKNVLKNTCLPFCFSNVVYIWIKNDALIELLFRNKIFVLDEMIQWNASLLSLVYYSWYMKTRPHGFFRLCWKKRRRKSRLQFDLYLYFYLWGLLYSFHLQYLQFWMPIYVFIVALCTHLSLLLIFIPWVVFLNVL